MLTPQRRRFVRTQVVWLLGALIALTVLGAYSPGLFVLLAVLGLVIGIELQIASTPPPRWYSRLRWLLALGLAGALLVMGVRFLQLSTSAVVP